MHEGGNSKNILQEIYLTISFTFNSVFYKPERWFLSVYSDVYIVNIFFCPSIHNKSLSSIFVFSCASLLLVFPRRSDVITAAPTFHELTQHSLTIQWPSYAEVMGSVKEKLAPSSGI